MQEDKKSLEDQVEFYLQEINQLQAKAVSTVTETKSPKVKRTTTNMSPPSGSKKHMGNFDKSLATNPQAALFSFYNKLHKCIKQHNLNLESLLTALNPSGSK
jgi:hypothetical protein